MIVQYECQGCREDIEIEVTQLYPAITSGPQRDWKPAEGGIDPDKCPYCHREIPAEDIYQLARDKAEDRYE